MHALCISLWPGKKLVDYDQVTNPMRSRRPAVSCIAYHAHVYIRGCFNGISNMCSGENTTLPITNRRRYGTRTTRAATSPYRSPKIWFALLEGLMWSLRSTTRSVMMRTMNEWQDATDMNIYRSALSVCIISGLPNVRDYIYEDREGLMDEKFQKI